MKKHSEYNKKLISLLDKEWEKSRQDSYEVSGEISETVKKRILITVSMKSKKGARWAKPLKIAASIILIISLSFFFNYITNNPEKPDHFLALGDAMIEKVAAPGTQLKVSLPDGTKVWLNNATKIRFHKKFDAQQRSVELEGEAFFEVTRDESRPFIIKSNGVETKVLGTSFVVSSFAGENTQVTVVTGKVGVSLENETVDKQVVLLPNEQATYSKSNRIMEKQNVDALDYLSWKSGILQFNKITLEEAVKKMERWYDVNIEISDESLKNHVIQGSYKNEKLRNVLRSFRFIKNLDFEIKENNEVLIYSKN